ncbi:neuropeptide SIFamide [Ischnura elegans]|uniref:neuropeptide SIFamide n=1 Tax=Ischnura elegans TaxID=197161 RepID=UPI001ED89BA6|nr:neuropeptide SIFamide [Ischnura elegans]
MNSRVILYFAVALVVLAMLSAGAGASSYRKAPMNGSIFGKRSGMNPGETESTRRVMFLCEVAVEACSMWYPRRDDSN